MGIFGVMFILALGYRYNVSVPHKHNILKRSTGWVSYVVLAIDGIVSILIGLASLVVISLLLLLLLLLYKFGFNWNVSTTLPYLKSLFILSENEYTRTLFFGLGIVFSYLANELRLRNNAYKTDYAELKSLDGILNIIIHAMETGTYIKVSLKSGKVYIGTVMSEQFEHGDLDNITLLPMESGYRDQDNLRLVLDCDYKEIYIKHGVVEKTATGLKYNPERAEDMMMVIRVNQIESLSLFDSSIYKEFEYRQKPKHLIVNPQ